MATAGSGGPFRDILGAKWFRKSIKLEIWGVLGDLGNQRSNKKGVRISSGNFLRAFFAPFGRFWAPFWPKLAAKGGPKIARLATMGEKITKSVKKYQKFWSRKPSRKIVIK